jgi:hypothetical protein
VASCRATFFLSSIRVGFLLALAIVVTSAEAAPSKHELIFDVAYTFRTYYYVADHAVGIEEGSLRVWKDDAIASNNYSAVPGLARLDPNRPPSDTNPENQGNFDLLRPGEDYVLLQGPGGVGPVPVIRLSRTLFSSELLAVTYVDQAPDPPLAVGALQDEADSVLVKPAGVVLLKALAIRANEYVIGRDGLYDPEGPWYPILSHELRNIYDLRTRDIPMDRLRLVIRKIVSGDSQDPDRVFDKPYLEHLGLDQHGVDGTGDPDGLVDDEFVDRVQGLLFFPDHHPFDPDTTRGECPPGRGGFLCLDDLQRNILRRDHADDLARSNPNVYFKPYILPSEDVRYYLDLTILPPPAPGGVLHQNAPNPFNPGTTIAFDLNLPGRVRLTVFDVQGRLVRLVLDEDLPAGHREVFWTGDGKDGRRVSSGVYYYSLEAGGHTYSRKMVLAR